MKNKNAKVRNDGHSHKQQNTVVPTFQEPTIREIKDLRCWLISDSHWGHANIVKYCSRPENHDWLMIERWQETVKENDVVLHLGDIAMSKRISDDLKEAIQNLPGRKYFIRGNHDKEQNWWYKELGFTRIDPFKINYRDWELYFTHRPGGDWKPFKEPGNWSRIIGADPKNTQLNLHGHIHNGYSIPDKRCMNFSVEVIDYTPQWAKTVIDERIDELTA